MNMNTWFGAGRLTGDAESFQTKNETTGCKFRLAVNDRRDKERTLFVNVLCFGKMAEALQPQLTKGRIVSTQGKLRIDEYVDKEENKRTSVCVMADEISLGPSADSIIRKPRETSDTKENGST